MNNLSRRLMALLMAFCLLLGTGIFWNKVSAADIHPAAVVSMEETGAYPLHSQKTTCKKNKKCTCTKKKCKGRKCAYCKAHKACKKNSKHKTHRASHC